MSTFFEQLKQVLNDMTTTVDAANKNTANPAVGTKVKSAQDTMIVKLEKALGKKIVVDDAPAEKIIKMSEYRAKRKEVRKQEMGLFLRALENTVHMLALPVVLPVRVITNVTIKTRGDEKKETGYVDKTFLNDQGQYNPLYLRSMLKEMCLTEDTFRRAEKTPLRAKFLGISKNYQRIQERALAEVPDHSGEIKSGKLVKLQPR